MKRVLQVRLLGDNSQTISIVHVLQFQQILFSCYLLELPWLNNRRNESCIPLGDYVLQKRKSNENGSRFSYPHLEVLGVYNRSAIKWHVANYVQELRGCGAPGLFVADLNRDGLIDVTNSRAALNRLLLFLEDKTPLRIITEK